MELSVGVLMAGSLYWDGGLREAWREARLVEEEWTVTAPVRYGRKSSKGTYSAVFSRGCAAGTAKVVRGGAAIGSVDDLVVEAEYLWRAERLSDRANHQLSAPWGCVALLVNPASEVGVAFVRRWGRRVAQEKVYGQVTQAQDEGRLVSAEGLISIPWPKVVNGLDAAGADKPVPLDLLLVTPTSPTLEAGAYPPVAMIAAGWGEDKTGEIRTLRENRANGIRTFEDEAIIGELRAHYPEAAAWVE
jgi:hypothetical protein